MSGHFKNVVVDSKGNLFAVGPYGGIYVRNEANTGWV